MRLPFSDGSGFSQAVKKTDSEIQGAFVHHMTRLVSGVATKAMLGDTSVVDQTTFDTRAIRKYFDKTAENLGSSWSGSGVSETRDDDVRRIFAKFETVYGDYMLSVHLSVQYHALLYYKPDARVSKIQKEIAGIAESANNDREQMAQKGDELIATRLKDMGYVEPDHSRLFEVLYNNETFAKDMAQEIEDAAGVEGLDVHTKRRDDLFAELNSLLMEVYNTTPVLIDETRLVTGEDGLLYTADIEMSSWDEKTNTQTNESRFDIGSMPDEARSQTLSRLRGLQDALVRASAQS